MPEEYRLTGVSRNFSTSANANDFLEFLPDFPLRHPENCPIEEDVLPSGELRMEARTDLEKARNATS
jgi:hypothetical protein